MHITEAQPEQLGDMAESALVGSMVPVQSDYTNHKGNDRH
jgi:hypothetical protein